MVSSWYILTTYDWTPFVLAFSHDDVTKWKHSPRNWPFVRGIHRSPVNSPHKDQWCGAFIFSLICAWIYRWVNNREAGDLRRHHPPLWRHCNDVFQQVCSPKYTCTHPIVHDMANNTITIPIVNLIVLITVVVTDYRYVNATQTNFIFG